MIYAYTIRRVAVVVLLGAFSSLLAPQAHAESQSLQIAGLSFASPLKTPLHFSLASNFSIKKSKPNTKLADMLVAPTPVLSITKPKTIKVSMLTQEIVEKPVSDLPTPTPTMQPTQAPETPQPSASNSNPGGLNADVLFAMVNTYRQNKGLPAFQKDDRACSLAQERAPEISEEIANNHMHSGMYGRHLPYWNTENIITMNSEKAAFDWWINDYIHRIQIEGNYTYSCVACSGNACAEEFTNFQPK